MRLVGSSRATRQDSVFVQRTSAVCLLCLLLLCLALDIRLGEIAEVGSVEPRAAEATGGFEIQQRPLAQRFQPPKGSITPTTVKKSRRFGADAPPVDSTLAPPQLRVGFNSSDTGARAPLIAVISTTADDVGNIMRWVRYHKALGVQRYYLFLTGTAATPEASSALAREVGVRVFRPHDDEQLMAEQAASWVWNASWLKTYVHKPCNHELFVAQSINMQTALEAALVDGITWVTHIDTDELLYPSGNHSFNLQRALDSIPVDMDLVVLPNYEGVPETHLVEDPFQEVTLFKRNRRHVQVEAYQKNIRKVAKGNPGFFFAYGNGKSIARVKSDIRPNGAHRFAYKWHNITETFHSSMAVLHYPYTRFQDLRGRRDRCDCLPVEEDAKRCFILQFDRMAFIQSSLLTQPALLQWYRDHVVFENKTLVNELCSSGVMQRIHVPQLMFDALQRSSQVRVERLWE